MKLKDYLLRKIEKTGSITSVLRQKKIGIKENLTITEQQAKNADGELLSEVNFDLHLDKLLDLNIERSDEYILSFDGFCVEKIEVLAAFFSEIGFSEKYENSKKYLAKSLQLYNMCNLKSKTYSLERETNISAIKNALKIE